MAMLVYQRVSYPCMVYILPVWHTLSTQPCAFSTGKKNTHFMWSVVATLRHSVLVPEAFGPLRQTWIQTKWTCPRIFLKQQKKKEIVGTVVY